MLTVLDEAIVEGKVITLAQLGDTGIIQAPAEDKGIIQAPAEDKGITMAQVGDKGITLAQMGDTGIIQAPVGDTGIIQAPAEDKGITQASVEDKGITQEDEEDKGGAMGAVEALDISQDGLGEAAKVVQLRIVTPWSKESQSWRERRQDWRPNGDPVPPPLTLPLPTLAEESVEPDTTELYLASATTDAVASPTAAPTLPLSALPPPQLRRRDLPSFGQAAGQLTMNWPDSPKSCSTEMLTMLPTRSSSLPHARLRLMYVQVELDLGCTTRTGNPRDCSPRPLFKRFFYSYLVLCITPFL